MRPIGVSILAVLVVIVGVLLVLTGILGLLAFVVLLSIEELKWLAQPTLLASLIVLVVGVILSVSGVGLWRLRMWAWTLAVIVLVFALLGQAVGFSLTSFVIELVLLVYLLAVRQHFF